jgi:multidrug efflux pump subunit AcrA (membrane-fusion protein)
LPILQYPNKNTEICFSYTPKTTLSLRAWNVLLKRSSRSMQLFRFLSGKVANSIDTATGTLSMKAEFDNKDNALFRTSS